jgi:hypothetical protein
MRGYEVHTIAGLPEKAFEALVKSGAISQTDIAAARALRGRTAKRHEEVTIRKSNDERHQAQVETVVQKVERAQRHAAALNDAITAYAKANGCARSIAMEAVLAHPTTSEYHRLDKALMAAERELAKLEGTADGNHPINRSKPARTPVPVRPSEAGRVPAGAAPTATNDEMTAEEVLERLADIQQTKNPAMSRGKAISMAALSPEFTQAFRREKLAKGF